MAVPSLPAQGSPNWFAWAQGLHSEVATGRLSDAALSAASVAAGREVFAPVGGPTTRLRAVAIGDSTVAGGLQDLLGTTVAVGNTYSWPNPGVIGQERPGVLSWFTWACLRSGGRLLALHNAGVASDNTPGCLARFADHVTAWKPDVVLIQGGIHNDPTTGISVTQGRDNIVAMIRAARAAGIIPVLVTAYPENNSTSTAQFLRRHNAWLKNLAAGRDATYTDIGGLICVDPYPAVTDPNSSTGAWNAAHTSDGTHATVAGAVAAADKILTDLGGLLRGNPNPSAGPHAAQDNVTGSPNLWIDPLCIAGTAWTGTSSGTTFSFVTDAAIRGKARQAVIASSTLNTYQQHNVDGTAITVGDRLKFSGLLKTSGAAAGALSYYARLQFPGAGVARIDPIPQVTGVDLDWTYFEAECVVPAGATLVRTGVFSTAGTGTILTAQFSLTNMSTL